MRGLPIPNINDSNSAELERLVDQILQLYHRKQDMKAPDILQQIQDKIDYCEDKINKLVYELYGLTEEEIKIIEAN